MCFSEKRFRGCFRQKRAEFSPQNESHSPFGPENRWGWFRTLDWKRVIQKNDFEGVLGKNK